MEKKNRLKRYTNITTLLHILHTKTITLLDPANWDDKNDSYSLNQFKKHEGLKSLLAICFTESAETYHHWHVFGGGASGVCINFHKDALLKSFTKRQGFEHGSANYKTLDDLRQVKPQVVELPFIKRAGYVDECEYRVIYKSKKTDVTFIDVGIAIECIDSIKLSPWVPDALRKSIRKTIKQIDGFEGRPSNFVAKSALTMSKEWMTLVDQAQ